MEARRASAESSALGAGAAAGAEHRTRRSNHIRAGEGRPLLQVRAGGRIPRGLVQEILQCVDKAGRALTHTHTIPTKGAKGRGAGRRRRGYTKGQ